MFSEACDQSASSIPIDSDPPPPSFYKEGALAPPVHLTPSACSTLLRITDVFLNNITYIIHTDVRLLTVQETVIFKTAAAEEGMKGVQGLLSWHRFCQGAIHIWSALWWKGVGICCCRQLLVPENISININTDLVLIWTLYKLYRIILDHLPFLDFFWKASLWKDSGDSAEDKITWQRAFRVSLVA